MAILRDGVSERWRFQVSIHVENISITLTWLVSGRETFAAVKEEARIRGLLL